ncbi:biosynthetic-type acetolactate synthase large subunit [Clostridium thermarum]|uniref:biosynthetic-type acetolactate synthase large subunit n=1 Tax=Clostridium thermarum TaxID=1716543 RepID=UPI0013D39656|nr:biosynthetic-type acetolactate synthase large subunit [Clostridium thermarum]
MKASEAIVKCLQEEKVDVIFGYPGAAVIPIYEELRKSKIRHILVRHEQGAGHCASGYARVTGKVGVCMVTSGPGATNVITAIATAYMDSIPMVILTGQVNLHQIGKDVFQEADITGSTEPFTKHNYLIKNENDIPRILKEAFHIAGTGRPGPVLVDIPMDLQNKDIDFDYSQEVNIRGYKPTVNGHILQIKKIVEKLENCSRPLVCVGGGVACSNAREELRTFLKLSGIPVVHTLLGKDSVESSYDRYLGLIGMHGFVSANKAVSRADVIICIGTRFGDRAIGPFKTGHHKDIIHIDIDPAEIGKSLSTLIPVVGDAKDILSQLNTMITPLDLTAWIRELQDIKSKDPALIQGNQQKNSDSSVNPKEAIKYISELVDENAILVSDVGQNQMWASRHFDIFQNRLFITSGGLGTMGYSLPAAIGAKVACPDRRVIVTLGDGSFQMSLQELGTIINTNVKLIIVLFNNSGLGMVRELQERVYQHTYGVDIEHNPDFTKIAEAYGLNAKKATNNEEFAQAFRWALDQSNTTLIECIVDPEVRTLL